MREMVFSHRKQIRLISLSGTLPFAGDALAQLPYSLFMLAISGISITVAIASHRPNVEKIDVAAVLAKTTLIFQCCLARVVLKSASVVSSA